MAYDEHLAERVRALLRGRDDLDERRMFGGRSFLLAGHLCCCVMGDGLMVRVGREQAERLLAAESAVRPMDLTGRPMRNWVIVDAEAVDEDAELERWVRIAEDFASSMPPKG